MKSDKYQLIEWHEERMTELLYPTEVVNELRRHRTKFLAKWKEQKVVPTVGLEPTPPRYEGGIPPSNTSRA